MTPQEMLHDIAENWFLREPAFYSLLCLQQEVENPHMECPMRCGKGRIEYNPLLLARKNYKETELLLRIEMIRLFLKHPYERRPEGCSGEAIALGSDCTIADGYCLLKEAGALKGPGYYHLPMGECYEWYCKQIENRKEKEPENNPDSSQQNQSDQQKSELWHDDSLMQIRINELIERTTDWGSLPADIVEQIQASTRAKLNRSMVFQGFRSNLFSAARILTRMRPNRRTGFLQMGSRRQIRARLLIAVDASASIDAPTLSRFYSLVNRLFVSTETEIHLLSFDTQLSPIQPWHQVQLNVQVTGRGGTSFQPVIDLFSASSAYDGLMILTDGEAPHPVITRKSAPILWVCNSEQAYRSNHAWMEQSGRCCWM